MSQYVKLGNRIQRGLGLATLPDLVGRIALVTGGTDGVGRALAEQLAGAGATTLLTARDAAKGQRVRQEIRAATGNDEVHVVALDLASIASIRGCAADVLRSWDRLDLLIANAGVMPRGGQRTTTVDGFESTIGVNHLGHALLIDLLEDRLKASTPSTVIIVASEAHRRAKGGLDFDDLMTADSNQLKLAYGRSKLANILYTRELARHLTGSGVTANAAHPGGVDTPMMRANFIGAAKHVVYLALRRTVLITPDDAAAGVLRVALDPELAATSGAYFEVGIEKRPKPWAEDDAAAARLWTVTHELLDNPHP